MAINVRPIGDRVVIKLETETNNKTAGGIYLPDTSSKDKPQKGEIVALGDGEKVKGIRIGDTVVYSKYSGTEVDVDDKKYLILNFSDVLAVVG